MIIKQPGQSHFPSDFGGGSVSFRIILPGQDDCRVKTTMFEPNKGFEQDEISYPVDETVFVVRGMIDLTLSGQDEVVELHAGGTYHVKAGEHYGLRVLADDTMLFCVFSPGPDGGSYAIHGSTHRSFPLEIKRTEYL